MADRVLVFDVNETLLDITTIEPLFARLFDDASVMRLWFAQLILYAQTVTLSGTYAPFGELAVGTLHMLGETEGVAVTDADTAELRHLLTNMPACPDVIPALTRLSDAGVRMVTLTNSPPTDSPTPMEKAGIAGFFEAHYSVHSIGKFKPHPDCYRMVADALGVPAGALCLVAAHLWDTVGAQAVGAQGAFITRVGNAMLPAGGIITPDYAAPDLGIFADQWLAPR
ncbi:haloacid dehalogenase type II [Loktanella sp. SALINAS62]|uniref:haloacid dehalogenase type II n=1 Tax=Loktanella sp. SALINAS62 TaxID=2706124 RepID=UPI001B8AA32C|nr:haloacid dehalogenase type II [Loktanella sp. SALINAS62]MBS1301239.1 haloacid dehalogenase type II [Loktanella sp. SALINAS62]